MVAHGQPFLLDLEAALLEQMADPDEGLPKTLASGCPVGVHEKIGVHLDIWPLRKEKQEYMTLPPELLSAERNYKSCTENIAQVRASYLEDVEEGRAFGPMTEAQAEQMCGGPLVHGALGAVEEFKTLPTGEKVREKHLTIHDGTAVGVNPRIQRNLMGRTTYTTIRPRGAADYENVAEIGPVETRHVRFGCEKCSPAMPLGPQRVAIRYSPSRRR